MEGKGEIADEKETVADDVRITDVGKELATNDVGVIDVEMTNVENEFV